MNMQPPFARICDYFSGGLPCQGRGRPGLGPYCPIPELGSAEVEGLSMGRYQPKLSGRSDTLPPLGNKGSFQSSGPWIEAKQPCHTPVGRVIMVSGSLCAGVFSLSVGERVDGWTG